MLLTKMKITVIAASILCVVSLPGLAKDICVKNDSPSFITLSFNKIVDPQALRRHASRCYEVTGSSCIPIAVMNGRGVKFQADKTSSYILKFDAKPFNTVTYLPTKDFTAASGLEPC